ncbi:MAG: ABC transporter ATP-binding protein [Actinobacteria bacterium]|nr:ABC transporter ATP-binding protein [Actinomycetota bacterium]
MPLELADVHAYYGLAHILQGVTLTVGTGELVALLGRNGAGKTTTLRSIVGLVRVRGGRVRIDGRDTTGMPTEHVAQLGVGYAPEERRMFPGISVAENLRLAALGARLGRRGVEAATQRVLKVFPALEPHLDRDASQLSGGQQQMVAIGRALIGGSRLLLVDEPTQGLAPTIAADIGTTLGRIADNGVAVLLVEQNSRMALDLADRAYVLDQGTIAASGTSSELRAHPEVIERFLRL